MRLAFRDIQAGRVDRLLAAGNSVVHEQIGIAGVLRFHVRADIEIFDLPADACSETFGIERVDESDSADAVAHIAPAVRGVITDRRDES